MVDIEEESPDEESELEVAPQSELAPEPEQEVTAEPAVEDVLVNLDNIEVEEHTSPELGDIDGISEKDSKLSLGEAAEQEPPTHDAFAVDLDEIDENEFAQPNVGAIDESEELVVPEPEASGEGENLFSHSIGEIEVEAFEQPELGNIEDTSDGVPFVDETTAELEVDDSSIPPVSIDDTDLPEYNEEDALEDAFSDQAGDIDSSLESSLDELPEPETTPIELAENDLPEYSEEDALADLDLEEMSDDEGDLGEDFHLDEIDLPDVAEVEVTGNEHFISGEQPATDEQPAPDDRDAQESEEMTLDEAREFDEASLRELLTEPSGDDTTPYIADSADNPDSSYNAGLDIEAMLEVGGEDWNGFSLSEEQQASIPDEVPSEEQSIWNEDNLPEQAEVQDENWENQHQINDLSNDSSQYRTIDELMAEIDQEESASNGEESSPDADLNVGLNEFPDVIGDIDEIDVDSNAEAAGKLDLAKIYIEMNDPQGAISLLEEALVDGDDEVRQAAKNLIDSLNNQR